MYTKDIGPEVGKPKPEFDLINFIIIAKEKNGYIRKKGYLSITQNQKDCNLALGVLYQPGKGMHWSTKSIYLALRASTL